MNKARLEKLVSLSFCICLAGTGCSSSSDSASKGKAAGNVAGGLHGSAGRDVDPGGGEVLLGRTVGPDLDLGDLAALHDLGESLHLNLDRLLRSGGRRAAQGRGGADRCGHEQGGRASNILAQKKRTALSN